ncbi:MAG: DUF2231 domain-containing protein [Methylococcales bacterium]|nr:DUF2231 domain-containing protein [Methylococcales bacterium]
MNVNNFLSFQLHGGSDHEGIAGNIEVLLSFLESLSGKSLTEIFTLIVPGISEMNNIHPLFVHFPIALLISFFLVDLLGSLLKKTHWRDIAGGLLYLGTLSALFTVIAGFFAAESVGHAEDVHEIMTRHQILGLSVLTLATILSGWRLLAHGKIKGEINIFYLIISAILSVLIVLGADLGGLMVYKYGVSVEAANIGKEAIFHEHTH